MFFKQFLLFFVGVNPIFVCLINHIYSIAYLFVKSQVLFSHSSQGLKTLEFSGKILVNYLLAKDQEASSFNEPANAVLSRGVNFPRSTGINNINDYRFDDFLISPFLL